MSVKSIVVLLMLLAAPGGGSKTCKMLREPANCKNNSRIRVSKADNTRYQLMLCANNQCSESTVINFKCESICDACEEVSSEQG